MKVLVLGTAKIRHRDTEQVFEIYPDELEWDAEGDDRQMGPEVHHQGTISHPDLGNLRWDLWEYPIGALNNTDRDLNGHEAVRDFELSLEHEEGEPYE